MTDYTKMIKTLRECANWFEAVAASSQYAHDELMALDYGDKLRDAADALEAVDKRIDELEKQVKNYRNDKMREDDPLRPMWPNWD